jgi:DNA-binding transcriptional regulator LsrR (DeoR family)
MIQEGDEVVETEVRRSKVMTLYSKGLTQEDIAKELGISQPTVCRDLDEMRKQSRKTVQKQVTEEALFEFSRWEAGLDQTARVAWKMAENENSSETAKLKAIEFLRDCYNLRLRMLIGSHPEGKKAQDHMVDIRWGKGPYEPDFRSRHEEN